MQQGQRQNRRNPLNVCHLQCHPRLDLKAADSKERRQAEKQEIEFGLKEYEDGKTI